MIMRKFNDGRVTLEMVLEEANRYADADSEDDRAYRAARMRYWRMFRAAVEQRAQRLVRKRARKSQCGEADR